MPDRDEHSEPEARRPRRPRSPEGRRPRSRPRPKSRRGGGGRGITFDRRLLFLAIAAVVLIVVLLLAVRQCQRDALVNSYKGYISDVTAVVDESHGQGQTMLATVNNQEGKNPTQIKQALRQLSDQAAETRDRADNLSPPGSLKSAHQSLLVALGFRAGGLKKLADEIDNISKLEDQAEAASSVAGSMQRFLASDVLYDDSFAAPARAALEEDGIVDVTVPQGDVKFLPGNNTALASANGARSLVPGLQGGGGGGTPGGAQNDTDPGSSLKGVSLESVVALPSGKRLVPATEVAVPSSSDLRWQVTIKNGGDFTETNVKVKAVLTFPGQAAETRESTLATISSGETKSIEIPTPSQLRFETAELVITAGPVPGETRVENNSATYKVKINLS